MAAAFSAPWPVEAFQISLIRQQALGLLPDGAEGFNHSLPHGGLEVAVALAGKFVLHQPPSVVPVTAA